MTRTRPALIVGLLLLFTLTTAAPNNAQEVPGWRITTVDSAGSVGTYTSLAVVDGQPAISYRDNTNTALKYARYNGATWDAETVDSTDNVGVFGLSLSVVDGQPAISYFDLTNLDLEYAHYNGTDWDFATIDTIGDVGSWSSLAVVDGQPAISYRDFTNLTLKYARYDGATWDVETVDSTVDVGENTSLAVVDGQPAISYYDTTNQDLRYARYNGTVWDIDPVDTGGNVGGFMSLAVVNGQPAISYYDTTNADLKYARYNGMVWVTETVDAIGSVGLYTSLAVVDGQPAISYYDTTNTDLKFARYNGAIWDIETVDSAGVVGWFTSLAVVNDQPGISYYDFTNDDLKFARLNTFPTSNSDNYTTTQDTTLNVAAPGVLENDADADNDALIAIVVNDPLDGSVTVNADGSFSYTPDAGFMGTDVFTYKADDGLNDSDVTVVRIIVNASNTAPIAADDSYSIAPDTMLNISAPGVLANDTDADGNNLSAATVTDPANGLMVLGSAGSFIYIPDDGFIGTDSFTYIANDGATASTAATVTIYVGVAAPTVTCPNIPDLAITAEMEDDPPEAPDYICTLPNQGRPTITWRNDPRADWYGVWVGNSESTVLFSWYPKASDELPPGGDVPFGAGAPVKAQCEGLTCTLKPDINPTAGSYQVWMQAWGTPTNNTDAGQFAIGGPLPEAPSWNGGDNEPNSGFTLANTSPGAITPLTSTIGTGGAVTFRWQGVDGATWYNIWIGTAPEEWDQLFFDWALAENLGCENGGVCTLTAGVDIASGGVFGLVLTPGDYVYYVQSWGPGGFSVGGNSGAWQESPVFTVP